LGCTFGLSDIHKTRNSSTWEQLVRRLRICQVNMKIYLLMIAIGNDATNLEISVLAEPDHEGGNVGLSTDPFSGNVFSTTAYHRMRMSREHHDGLYSPE
jgi:hypothetical protein